MVSSKQLLVALLLGALVGHAHGIEGDVLAASDFRSGTQDWVLKGLGTATGWSNEGLQSEGDVIAAIDSPSDTGRNWYYSAPKAFLGGDKSLAYNGWLVFDFGHFEYESMGMPAMNGYDVYLQAKNKKFTLGLKGVFKMDDNKLSNTYSVRLEEDFTAPGSSATWEMVNVVKAVDGKLVTKAPTQHEFITCLQSLTGIWIRGSYFQGSEASWLKDVKIIQGAVNKGGDPRGAAATLVNGSMVYSDKTAPPTASATCCSSRTCVSNDKYEISFDRPGCMHSSDMYCCMSSDSCTKYSRYYHDSKAAEVIRGTDFNEGRAFFTPGTVDTCRGEGTGQHGAKFSSCYSDITPPLPAYGQKPSAWHTGTKNQNMGLKSIPITKPFVKDYYMGSVPRICSPATLTIEAHGDLADSKDNIMVYGEDDVYLGTIFAGNLTYLKEGHRSYDAYGPNTDCEGTYSPQVKDSGENARLADPQHPTGNRPQHKGYRGGRNDVVTPGVFGNEDTRCSRWQAGGKQPLSLQHSDSMPYVDSIAISQDRMMQYSADGQMKFTFRSVRDDSAANAFSGTGGGGSTRFCNFGSGANDCGTGTACEGCDLDGKVIFRSIKLKFSAGVCYTKSAATDYSFEYIPQIHTPQNLNISVTYTVPSGDNGQPGGDAAFSVTAGADIFGLDKKLVVYDKDLNKVGELFARESFQSLRTHMSDDSMVTTTAFGAKDSPTPFHSKTNCDTTSPIVSTDRCAQPDNQWSMKSSLINYTDTLRIPRENIAKMAVNGKVQLYITADVPANAFSLSTESKARFSPITLAYPLMHCFMKAIKTGPNFGIFLDRPMSYYFKETGFPMPAGDVTVFVAASWQNHVRYVTRHVGAAVGDKFAYDGVEDGLPVMRVDKDTVADMGTVWVYKNSNGDECCPSTHRPTAADGMHVITEYSNCLGTGACTDPNLSTEDACTEENQCPIKVLAGTDSTTILVVDAGTPTVLQPVEGLYVGMKIILYAPLKTGNDNGITFAGAAGAGCTPDTYALSITGGGGGGAVCTATVAAGGAIVTGTACSALGAYRSVPTVTFADGVAHGCTTLPVFVAVLETSNGADTVVANSPVRTIVRYYLDTTWKVEVDEAYAAAPDVKNIFRISAELGEDARATNTPAGVVSQAAFSRNQRDGGTSTGTVAVPVSASVSCTTRSFKVGTVEAYDNTAKLVRLDTEASTFDTAYNGYKIKVTKKDGAYDVKSILAYSGTIAGRVATAAAATNTLTITLAAVAAVTGEQIGATGAVTSAAVTQALSSTDDWYNGVDIEIDIDGDASTSDDIYVRKISDYAGTGTVKIKRPLVRKFLFSGKPVADSASATTVKADHTKLSANVQTADAYNGMYILIDIDGYPETEDDLYFEAITDYAYDNTANAEHGLITVGNAMGTSTPASTYWIIESLTDLDVPMFSSATLASTFRIYTRSALLDSTLETIAGTHEVGGSVLTALGAAATVGAASITLNAPASTDADDYYRMKLRLTENGVTDEYTVTQWAATTFVASVSPVLQRSYTTAAKFELFRVYEIYQDLGTECMQNVNMTVTYTYGTARTVSNDPGELSTIYSNWDRELARSYSPGSLPEQRDVRSWTLKLAGEGYYHNLYPGQGLGSWDNNINKAAGTQIATTAKPADGGTSTEMKITTSNAGLQVGQYVKITDNGVPSEQYEIVKILQIKDADDVEIARAQLGTLAQTFTSATLFVYTVGFNQGQGMDEMAELHRQYAGAADDNDFSLSRYSSSINDAYTGLWVTIVSGAGAGQTRWISDYHGSSRTAYVGAPWSIIPDTTSKYKIWYSSEIVEFTTSGNLAIATYPRPVKKGYLVEFHWYSCAQDVPPTFQNNYDNTAHQTRPGLAECKGQLGMRRPKQGPAVVYPRFKVLQTDYVVGKLAAATSTTHLTLDRNAETAHGFYVGRKIIVKDTNNAVRGTSTIMYSYLGASFTEVHLDQAITGAAQNDPYTITPADGMSGKTTISENGQNGDQYTMEEVDVVRYEYPELIQQHREWPHGYSYLQMKAGEDGEHVGNLFLKDYTQYSTESYYTDSITIPKSVFENYVRKNPNGVSGEFPFTLKTPPGKGNIELLSLVIGYPVLNKEDASSYDSTDIETKRHSSHGPPPFFPYSSGWSGVDESARQTRTHPRFQTHAYTSTCGNGVHDAGEFCDDANQNDGDGCSSGCALEAGWVCETVSLTAPSICRKGLVGARIPDQEIGCKAYACEPPVVNAAANDGPVITQGNVDAWIAAYNLDASNPTGRGGRAIICSGTPTDGVQTTYTNGPPFGPSYPICKLATFQGTCSLCINWDNSDATPVNVDLANNVNNDNTGTSGGILGSSGVGGYDGISKRRLMEAPSDESAPSTETVTL